MNESDNGTSVVEHVGPDVLSIVSKMTGNRPDAWYNVLVSELYASDSPSLPFPSEQSSVEEPVILFSVKSDSGVLPPSPVTPNRVPVELKVIPANLSPVSPTSVATPDVGFMVTSARVVEKIEVLSNAQSVPSVGSAASPVPPETESPSSVIVVEERVVPESGLTVLQHYSVHLEMEVMVSHLRTILTLTHYTTHQVYSLSS